MLTDIKHLFTNSLIEWSCSDEDFSFFKAFDLWWKRYSVQSVCTSCLSRGLCTAFSNADSGVRLPHKDGDGGEISSNRLRTNHKTH